MNISIVGKVEEGNILDEQDTILKLLIFTYLL